MESDKQQLEELAVDAAPVRFDIQTGIALTYDIKAPKMLMYLLTEDRLDSLETGSESLDSTFFGAFLGITLAATGIAIPLYYSATTAVPPVPLGMLFLACVLVAIVCALVAIYFGVKTWQIRTRSKRKFRDIKEKSATIVTLTPKKPE